MGEESDPRSARESRGLTREQLAAIAEVSITTVATCEQQRRWPKQIRIRQRYFAALGIRENLGETR